MGYRHLWPGLALIAALLLLLASLLAWGEHLLSPAPSGGLRRLLHAWPAVREPSPSVDPGAAGSMPAEPAPVDPRAGALPVDDRGNRPDARPAAGGPPRAADARDQERAAPRRAPPPAPSPRYALEMGAFVTAEEADAVEARLSQAGFSTIRFRRQGPGGLYAVVVEPVGGPDEASAVVDRLRRNGFPEPAVLGGTQGLAVKVGEPAPLRAAVTLAARLRSAGFEVRIAAQPGRGSEITVRHGNFASREEAQRASEAVARLGVPNEVVRAQ
jgi:cell division protein FtsN